MDKKSILLGIVFLAGGFLLMTYNGMQETKARQEKLLQQASENEQALRESDWDTAPTNPDETAFAPAETGPPPIEERIETATPIVDRPEEVLVTLENRDLAVTLSSYGGAIGEIVLKNYPNENPHTNENPNPVVLNKVSDQQALALNRSTGSQMAPMARFYELVRQTDSSATFKATLPSGLVITREYTLSMGDDPDSPNPYVISHITSLSNASSQAIILDRAFLNIGTAAPTAADYMGFNLNASYFENGDYDNIPASKFAGGGFIFKREPKEFIEERGVIQWGAVKNQFFVTIFTPERPAEGLIARGIRFPQDPKTGKVPTGVTAALEFGIPILQPGEKHVVSGGFYAGPKNHDRLSQLGNKQEDVMQLGWFLGMFLGAISFVATMLLTLMGGIHNLLGNWGLAIIITTFVIRLLLWPLTAKAARSSKRMQELQKPLQEIREKYQDNPQKLNAEMMKLWKRHKINPLSGCWPVLIQFPIFISFFNLLRNSSDLRFAEFLWIHDLSMPDATIPIPGDAALPFIGTAINILPFIWVVSMYFQMKMMPTPSIDNAQTKIIKWMPFIFFPFTYYFSSGLVLYWTTTNCFSIFQQWITNRTRDEEDVAIEEEIAEMEDKKKGKLPSGPLISKKKKNRKKDSR
ncbi:membrane protein insertase YidC [Puniceicoccales bacterium CK1056]|uniref:Membrane protein insertase YidC n=1 Tax=Oceanipulchritudo coccoides TaxID=2706888 RepID=A0A6B2M207_9BACT|nr:membrane protein insertase YidC [Oceanipulchritudo coccoides]NDV62117.1 membrane protein insertase YidC [Oceanipulchritudo coccoides]